MAAEQAYVADTEQQMSLSDLPEPLLLDMLRHLDGPELGKLCTQDRRLRQLASEQSLWQALSLIRWPNCSVEHYNGDWQQLYRHRAVLPTSFCTYVDRLHSLTAQASGQQQLRVNSSSISSCDSSPSMSPESSPVKSHLYGFSQLPYARIPSMMFDKVMMALFDLSLLSARATEDISSYSSTITSTTSSHVSAALAAEMTGVKQAMAWWLNNRAEAIIQFARRSVSLLDTWDMWGGGITSWSDVLVRRSALEFLSDMNLDKYSHNICPSVCDRLQREVDRLDDVLRRIDAEGSTCLVTRKPEGLPAKHWWYNLKGLTTGVC
eukprot:GHUV01017749.1.p1 GENE.GHUV01017749.1~~GHUV01017749.1.p1  ORF type:complete len:321 (+),score=85.65 GHUV01017749.1:1193-2155(+)